MRLLHRALHDAPPHTVAGIHRFPFQPGKLHGMQARIRRESYHTPAAPERRTKTMLQTRPCSDKEGRPCFILLEQVSQRTRSPFPCCLHPGITVVLYDAERAPYGSCAAHHFKPPHGPPRMRLISHAWQLHCCMSTSVRAPMQPALDRGPCACRVITTHGVLAFSPRLAAV